MADELLRRNVRTVRRLAALLAAKVGLAALRPNSTAQDSKLCQSRDTATL